MSVINLSGLPSPEGFVVNGNSSSDQSGHSVSSIGDFNGDGIDDFIIGAPFADPNSVSNAGQSYVVFGSNSLSSVSNVDLSNLTNTPTSAPNYGFKITGFRNFGRSGYSVSSAGDVNGDGKDDLIIGAPDARNASLFGNPHGESYVVFGGYTGNSLDLGTLNPSQGFILDGFTGYDVSGYSVSSAGDVNNDGFDDLIIGVPLADPNSVSNAGQSYVVFGDSSIGNTGNINLPASANGTDGFVINGIGNDDLSGASVSNVGDINNDGIDDLAIRAINFDPNGIDPVGETYVVFGDSSIGSTGTINLSNLNGSNGFKIEGITLNPNIDLRRDFPVNNAGDVNGDGIDDMIIGTPVADPNGSNSGQSHVIFGRNSSNPFPATLNLSGFPNTYGFAINGINPDDLSGSSVSSAGDFNKDGYDDVIIGAPVANDSKGQSYVVFGDSNIGSTNFDLSTLTSGSSTDGILINGINPDDLSGASVSNAGDINADGGDDLIIGAPRFDSSTGESYVLFGECDENIGETGTISVDHNTQTITLSQSYSNPVVFAQPASDNESTPVAVRLDNITNNSFDISLQEPSNEDGIHALEDLSYIVLEAGKWELANGTKLQVGTTNSSQLVTQGWENVYLNAGFSSNPVVMSQIQTSNGADFVRTRQRNIGTNGFQVGMEEEELKQNSGHTNETIGYFAIDSAISNWSGLNYQALYTPDNVTNAWTPVLHAPFSQQPQILASLASYDGSDPAGIRYRNVPGSIEFKVEEDTSFDSEMNHTDETVSFLAIEGSGSLSACAMPNAMGETGAISNLTHTAQTINLARNYSNPVVFAQPVSDNESTPVAVRIDNVTSNSFEVSLQEPSNEDGIHVPEDLSYIVLEAGNWELANGAKLQVGTTDSNQLVSNNPSGWENVNFNLDFGSGNNPVVMSQIQTSNGSDFVRTRQRDITTNGFQVGMEEQESLKNSGHTNETIGYFAISEGSGSWSGFDYTADYTGNIVTDAWTTRIWARFTERWIF
ncbi:MAG: integrin alpha [Cyanobacteria bacterium P01_D01_bin.50]